MKESFVFYKEWQDVLMEYSAEVRLEVYDAIIRYACSGTLSELKPLSAMAFSFIKKKLDADSQRYEETCKKRSEAGRKGGSSKQSQAKQANASFAKQNKQSQAKQADNDNEYDTLPTNVGESNKEKAITLVIAKKKDAATAATNQRKTKFYDAIKPYVGIYGADMCRNFFDYWSELNKSGTKMRWEQQPTWELELRLKTWSKNETKYAKRTDKYEQKRSDAAAIDAQIAADVERLNAEFIANGCKPVAEQISDIDELYGCLQPEPSGSDDRAAPG